MIRNGSENEDCRSTVQTGLDTWLPAVQATPKGKACVLELHLTAKTFSTGKIPYTSKALNTTMQSKCSLESIINLETILQCHLL